MLELNRESESPDLGLILISGIGFRGGSSSQLSYKNNHRLSCTMAHREGGWSQIGFQGGWGGEGGAAAQINEGGGTDMLE